MYDTPADKFATSINAYDGWILRKEAKERIINAYGTSYLDLSELVKILEKKCGKEEMAPSCFFLTSFNNCIYQNNHAIVFII